ncbi:MAG: autotransporter domain-containing protein [Polyangiaceae bacterium]|nr:autotransporter domain-containing protein [Polyangiaceae bacterium]
MPRSPALAGLFAALLAAHAAAQAPAEGAPPQPVGPAGGVSSPAPAAPPPPGPGAAPPAPGPGAAPPPPAPSAPPPQFYPPALPPPLPPPDTARRGAHEHDGFFLRMGLGFAAMMTKTESTLGQATEGGDLSGGGGTLELLLGGTPAPGLVLGGGLIGHTFTEPDYEVDGTSTRLEDTELGLTYLALFGQLYFDPEGGAHVQALVAAAEESYRYPLAGTERESELSGVGVGLGAGYDLWIGDQWSLGPAARVSWATVKHDADGVVTRHKTTTFSLSLTATLH